MVGNSITTLNPTGEMLIEVSVCKVLPDDGVTDEKHCLQTASNPVIHLFQAKHPVGAL